MPATVTFNTGTTITANNSNVTWLKALGPAIGLADTALVKDTTTEIIYKITQGTGTYADTYMRIRTAALYYYIQFGTGYNTGTGVLTGAGTERVFSYESSASRTAYVRTILTSDNTFGFAQICDTTNTNLINVSFGYIKPTNTTLTAATIPLTAGLHYGWSFNYNVRYGNFRNVINNTATVTDWQPRYQSVDGSTMIGVGINCAGYIHGATAYGSRVGYMLGMSGEIQTQATSTSTGSTSSGCVCPAIGFGLQYAEGSSQGIIPNVPIFSGGRIIGYNSNLAYCSPALAMGDRIVVSAGVEEYIKIDDAGIAVRSV